MRNRFYKIFVAVCYTVVLANCSIAQESIRLNQTGFYPQGPKFAVAIGSISDTFYLTSQDLADTVFTGSLGEARVWSHSGETVKLIDFSEFQTEGTYTIAIADLGQSYSFQIAKYVHQPISMASIKAYYFQRMSTPLTIEYAGIWNRPAGHPDNQVYVHASAATDLRPTNTIISAPKGWYDAGDFNKYIVNSGISTYTILAAYEHFPQYYQQLALNIPESGNDVPDILDEALWNLRWMLKMQDPGDGGVYHKLTTANFAGAVMPHASTASRFVVQKSTPAALDFAAVMAQASRIFSGFETQFLGLADSCLTAALDAWSWARLYPDSIYNQSAMNSRFNPDINTGGYGESYFTDEFQWASAELFITTKADSFLAIGNPLSGPFGIPWWGGVNTLGLYSLIHHRKNISTAIDTTAAINSLLNLANPLRNHVNNSAYHIIMGEANENFVWGSNGTAANQAMALIQAYKISGDESYLNAALQNLDYLLGRNAVGFSFVTNYGTKSTQHPHHRQSEADGVSSPVPGLLAGGPNPGRDDGCSGYIGTGRATSYVDSWCSYASNEIAINWNAPLVYISGAIEATYSASGQPTAIPTKKIGQVIPEGYQLDENYPNPFNPTTTIRYRLGANTPVQLLVYDISGRKIETLVNQDQPSGDYNVVFNAERLASGVYIYKLNAAGFEQSRKMILLR